MQSLVDSWLGWAGYPDSAAYGELLLVVPQYQYLGAVLGTLLSGLAGASVSVVVDALRNSRSRTGHVALLLVGGSSLAGGVWAMHFLAVLSTAFPMQVAHDGPQTLLSLVLGLVGCVIAIHFFTVARSPLVRVTFAAVTFSVTVTAVYYSGMGALQGVAGLYVKPLQAFLVLVYTTGVSWLVWAALEKTHSAKNIPDVIRPLGGLLFGVCVGGAHFSGMSAIEIYAHSVDESYTLPAGEMLSAVLAVAAVVSVAFVVSLTFSHFNALRRRLLAEQGLMSHVLEEVESLYLLVEASGTILKANRAAAAVFGAEHTAVGVNLGGLVNEAELTSIGDRLATWDGRRITLTVSGTYGLPDSTESRVCTLEMRVDSFVYNETKYFCLIGHDISAEAEEHERMRFLTAALDVCEEMIFVGDKDMHIIYMNPSARSTLRSPVSGYVGRHLSEVFHPLVADASLAEMMAAVGNGEIWNGKVRRQHPDGLRIERMSIAPVRDDKGNIIQFVSISRDITEDLAMSDQLQQAQKLESIGQLAAGIAHEINTPIQYVSDNIRYLGEAFEDVSGLVASLKTAARSQVPVSAENIDKALKDADIDFALEEVPGAIEQAAEGAARVSKIVRAMKDFSHPSDEVAPADINKAVSSTVEVAKNEWKYVADLELDLDESLPMIPCVVGEVNQCVLNIVVNAAHAIADMTSTNQSHRGAIKLSTSTRDGYGIICIEDDGPGMSAELQEKIFMPFFTTKEVGKGTGQGLAIAYKSIVERHGGLLTVESAPGSGAQFVIALPLETASKDDDMLRETA